jgi:hypothetical protein
MAESTFIVRGNAGKGKWEKWGVKGEGLWVEGKGEG